MKIFVVTQNCWGRTTNTLVTTQFDKAVNQLLVFDSEISILEVWEDNKELHSYGRYMNQLINQINKNNLTFKTLKEDILKCWGMKL